MTFRNQWRSQELFPGGAKVRAFGDGSSQWGPGAKPWWGSEDKAPRSFSCLTIKYVHLYSTYVNQGRSDDSDTAHNADTDRQWHRHHHTPVLLPPPVSQISHRICKNYRSGLGSPGEQLLHLLHTSYATAQNHSVNSRRFFGHLSVCGLRKDLAYSDVNLFCVA